LTQPVFVLPVPSLWQQARLSHEFFHQTAKVLQKQFKISISEAKTILQACPDCQRVAKGPTAAVNPRGLAALPLWQTAITDVAEFGGLKYVHVSVETFSMAMRATAL
ncbi:POK11 protein, partial [Psophia crepitans]|nr:POK11 protein [Psophia crepitans]